MSISIEFMKQYCDFSDPNWVWIMTGISRNKDNDKSGVKFLRRMVVTNPSDIETCYDEIKLFANDINTTYRIYISLNARDVTKVTFGFQKTMLDIGYGLARGLPDALVQAKKLGSIWKTELAQTDCRGTKRVLLDIDEATCIQYGLLMDYIAKIDPSKTKVYATRITPNGYHIVLDAFDTRELMKFCENNGIKADLHRDSMVFVEQFNGWVVDHGIY